ncbi:unnamed protein product [Caenorhabditis auriculariae]|uniref:Uncharacterized protein n=1 Tax=Caenorhabditis auriculariae TaxID=2777116 RepID=A0A8S1HHK2_9PELO|nr:unnamed protein product [Caenorhabditis auriculariae]
MRPGTHGKLLERLIGFRFSQLTIGAHVDEKTCPEDCEDISFSSIVFGGKLVHSEILSLLPSDWEETKEKRLAKYQKALEVIPNDRIPVVRNVQQLALELQEFVSEATQIFDQKGDAPSSTVACMAPNGRSFEAFLNQINAQESFWERITAYVQRSLARELNSTTLCIGIRLDDDGSIDENFPSQVNTSLASLALLHLSEIENALQTPSFNYGLKMMRENTRKIVLTMALPLIRDMRDCVKKMYDNEERVGEIAQDCRLVGLRYSPFLDASLFYTTLNFQNFIFSNYFDEIRKITTRISQLRNRVKMVNWHNHNINLKEFESLYREGAKDHSEIEETLKLRKLIVADIAEAVEPLKKSLAAALEARGRFLSKAGMENNVSRIEPIRQSVQCLKEMIRKIPSLKKSRFIRGEWLSRLRSQVLLAQSYSATPQYDEVNLLHIKFYFAHFKQETIAQERSYNMFLLLAEIGGTIGLYVGATLLTVAETVVFFFERKTRNYLLKKNYV